MINFCVMIIDKLVTYNSKVVMEKEIFQVIELKFKLEAPKNLYCCPDLTSGSQELILLS